MYFAVHLISESTDHYNMLLQADTPEQLVEEVKKNCDDFAYIADAYVDGEGLSWKKNQKFVTAVWNAIEAARDEEEE